MSWQRGEALTERTDIPLVYLNYCNECRTDLFYMLGGRDSTRG